MRPYFFLDLGHLLVLSYLRRSFQKFQMPAVFRLLPHALQAIAPVPVRLCLVQTKFRYRLYSSAFGALLVFNLDISYLTP